MKIKHCLYNLLILLIYASNIKGQISPGPLANDHAHLEGLSNCTQCHDLGNQVPDMKCLACHAEIDQLILQNKGYHASRDVKAKSCVECHNDHHGRKFDIIRFDEANFNHDLTGYSLEGGHAQIECRDCHQPKFIIDSELKNRSETFLGLKSSCLNCHDDFHQGSLSNDCVSCHDFNAFRPASLFDHEDTDYPLRGAHVNIDCAACHSTETRNGDTYQNFSNLRFGDCNNCHNDPHMGNLNESRCNNCHTVQSFKNSNAQRNFNHNITAFELKGKHQSLACFDCHLYQDNPALIFQSEKGTEESQCIACHEDAHDGKFGTTCVDCHNENDFYDLSSMSSFNHDLTDYPLEGLHVQVECASCHTNRYTDQINHANCFDCHEDYHRGEFTVATERRDCNQCHTLEASFEYTLFGLQEHQETIFPLEGAHLATPCFACHLSENQWGFKDIGTDCIACHVDIHEGYISEVYYPEKNCQACHSTERWSEISFDHSTTDWPLVSRHQAISCSACHFENSEESNNLRFNTIQSDCFDCHDNPHDIQFEIQGITDCKRCHDPVSWYPSKFDHDGTAFPLEGKHAEIDCKACHKPSDISINGFIDYKIQNFECIDCHG